MLENEKHSEIALKKSALEFMRVLLDTIPNPIYYSNVEGEYLGGNKAFATLYDLLKK